MASLNLGTLIVNIKANLAEFNKGLNSAVGKLGAVRGELLVAGAAFGAATAGLTLFGSSSLKVFAGFERSMVRAGSKVNATTEQMELLTKTARGLARETQFTAQQTADAMDFMAQSGFKVGEIVTGLPSVMELASAAMIDVATAADISTNIMRGMGKEVEDLAEINNVLVRASTGSNTNIQQLGEAFKFAAPVARAAGVSFEDTTTALALMGNAGIQASLAGTTLRGSIARLLSPTGKAKEILEKLNITASKAPGVLKPFNEILRDLKKSGANAAEIMEVFGLRAGPGMATLLEQGDEAFMKFIDRLSDTSITTKELAEKSMATLQGSTERLQSAFQDMQITLGGRLAPAMTSVNELVIEMINDFGDLNDSSKGLIVRFGLVTTGILAAGTGFITFAAVLPSIIAGFTAIKVGAIALLPALLPVLGTMLAVGAAVGSVVAAAGAIKRATSGGGKSGALPTADLIPNLKAGFKELLAGLGIDFDKTKDKSSELAESIAKAKAELDKFTKSTKKTDKEFGKTGDAAEKSAKGLGKLDDSLVGMLALVDISKVPEKSQEDAEKMFRASDAGRATLASAATEGIPNLDEQVEASDEEIRIRGGINNTLKKAGKGILASTGTLGTAISSAIAGFAEGGVISAVIEFFGAILGEFEGFEDILNTFGDVLGTIIDTIAPLIDGFAEAVSAVGNAFNSVLNLLNSLGLREIMQAVGAALQAVGKLFEGLATVISKVSKFVEKQRGRFQRILDEKLLKKTSDFVKARSKKVSARFVRNIDRAADALLVEDEETGIASVKSVDTLLGSDFLVKTRALVEATRRAAEINDKLADKADDTGDALDGLEEPLSAFGERVSEATESLMNVPKGFKVAAARFAAAAGGVGAMTTGGLGISGQVNARPPVVIENVEIKNDDPFAIWIALKEIIAAENFADTGTTVGVASPFSLPPNGGSGQ